MSKKNTVETHTTLLGRIGSNLKIGIVGLPNVGKSTFFNALTNSNANAESYPFCTIDPNESRTRVPDERYEWLCEYYKPLNRVPAYLNVLDIAGLLRGAHEGQGLGNAFLSHIRGVDAIFHMIRIFEDDDIQHVEGDVDPVRDMDIINQELLMKDVEYVQKELEKLKKGASRSGDKKLQAECSCMAKVHDLLVEEKKHVRLVEWNSKEIAILNQHLLITAKPVIYLINMSKKDYIRKKNKWLPKIVAWVNQNDPGAPSIPFSAEFELEWTNLDENGKTELKNELGVSVNSCIDKIIRTGYSTLGLQYFFTVGKDEVRAWTIQKGTKAPQAAGKIHTDMEKGFIMAEVMNYSDFRELGSEAAVKAAGKYKQKGKEYVVEDGDIILIKFNAGAGLTAKKK